MVKVRSVAAVLESRRAPTKVVCAARLCDEAKEVMLPVPNVVA